jgi:glycosyltransferase involved in cell wall biosynthesis
VIVALTAQIGHYHNVRYAAANARLGNLIVASVANEADFQEFLSNTVGKYRVERLYRGIAEYRDGIANGKVWVKVQSLLALLAPDVVAVTGWSTPESFAAIAWARRNGRRIVVMSDSQADDAPRLKLRETIKSRLVRACDAALVAGERHRDYVVALGIPEHRTFLGFDVVDNAYFQSGAATARADAAAVRTRHALPERYLLASARFIAKKNLPRLIESYALAIAGLDAAPDLVLLDDGPERPAVEAAIKRAGIIGRVHLPGFRSYELLPIFYGLAEAFVHVSTTEQWGLVINEAAASGLPLIVSRACGASGELVRHDVNGFVVDACDTDRITDVLRRMTTLTPEARAAMGEASRLIVANWGPERFASGFAAACEAALAQPSRRLAPWDAALIRALARREIKSVA